MPNHHNTLTCLILCSSFDPAADAPDSKSAAQNKGDSDLGFSFTATAGFWHSVAAITGFAESYEVSFQHWIFTGLVLSLVCASFIACHHSSTLTQLHFTHETSNSSIAVITSTHDGWTGTSGFAGITLSFGIAWPPGSSVSIDEAKCWGERVSVRPHITIIYHHPPKLMINLFALIYSFHSPSRFPILLRNGLQASLPVLRKRTPLSSSSQTIQAPATLFTTTKQATIMTAEIGY